MKQKNLALAIPLSAVAIIIGAILWKTFSSPPAKPPPAPAVVSSTFVTEELREPSIPAVGTLVAIEGIDVSTEVDGLVSEIVFTSGQPVAKGDTLIKLDTEVDTAALEALKAEQRLAEVQFNRAKNLLKQKVSSKSEFDEAQARYQAAVARVKQQQAIIQRKLIRAPFDGYAGIRKIALGQYLEAGHPIVSLQKLDPIHVDYSLPERVTTEVKVGQAVKVKVDAIENKSFTGSVTAINANIDTATRTLKVRATLDNTDGLLRPGMFAKVSTITGTGIPTLTLPRTAVSVNTYGEYVYVIDKNDEDQLVVKRTTVKLGDAIEGRVAISNLPKDTQVVRTGLIKLRDGMTISIDNQITLDDAGISGE